LGVLDAAECPPTFGVPPERVQGVMAGGAEALFRSREGSEDRAGDGARDLAVRGFSAKDVLVGISASGRTPYVLGAVAYAHSLGAFTVGLCSNPDGELNRLADIAIRPVTGPEVITGSTRMKSGTAQKLVLNMISTAVMVRMGYVLGNLMVNVQLNSEKLIDRARRIVAAVAGCSEEPAKRALEASGTRPRVAIVMAKLDLDARAAQARLEENGDSLWEALRPAAEPHPTQG
jgi:N-acetylmuramic acid 6-phosphate etherase